MSLYIYLDIEHKQHSSYHIISNDNNEEDEDKYGIKFNKILIINYKKYEVDI